MKDKEICKGGSEKKEKMGDKDGIKTDERGDARGKRNLKWKR